MYDEVDETLHCEVKSAVHDIRFDKTLIAKAKVSAEFEFLRANEKTYEYFQCTPAQLIGRTFTDITPEPDRSLDAKNARMVIAGVIDTYQFPKQYQLPWMKDTVYAVIDVLGVRAPNGDFLYFDVEIIKISEKSYHELRRTVLKEESKSLQRFLLSSGDINIRELKGLFMWASIGLALLLSFTKDGRDVLHTVLERLLP